jgi:hypothetical protein
MPYSITNPPDVIKKLTPKKQKQWIAIWNDCHERGQPEEQCFKTAWGVVKKASDEGVIIGPGESEGSIRDATKNKDILDATEVDRAVSAGLMTLADEIGNFNYRLGMSIAQEARKLVR